MPNDSRHRCQRFRAVVGADDDRNKRQSGRDGDAAMAASSCPSLSRKAKNDFFGSRSRVTSPNAQSVISCSPVNHSSVQAKKMVPATPHSHHAFEMPAEHFGLLLFRMANRVHAEFAEDERLVFREILQPSR